LNLPEEVLKEMIRIVEHPNGLSRIVNEQAIAEGFRTFLAGRERSNGKKGLKANLKQLAKRIIPEQALASFRKSAKLQRKVSPQMVFKRYFAMKIYLDSIS
jgi:hypothetical protein